MIPQKPTDKEAVRVLAIEIGCRPAARRLGLNENTVVQWSKRFGWFKQPKLPPTHNDSKAVISVIKPGDALIAMHKELETKTKSGLASAAAKAADHASSLDGAITFGHSNKLRDLAASAARIFGWDTKQPQTQINQLCITQEQLQEIRALREQADAQE